MVLSQQLRDVLRLQAFDRWVLSVLIGYMQRAVGACGFNRFIDMDFLGGNDTVGAQ